MTAVLAGATNLCVGVDATCWQNSRGFGRHARALLSALVQLDRENRYTFVMDSADQSQAVPKEAQVRLVAASTPTALAASADARRSLRDLWRLSHALSDPGFDVLLFPTAYSYVPVVSRAKKLVMIHDVTAEKYPQLTVPRPTARLLWNTKLALARWQADVIVTVSEYSRRGIVEQFAIAPERVFVVGEASDSVFRVLDEPRPTARLASHGIASADRLVVYVGGFGPHKNLETLARAFAVDTAESGRSNVRLVLVGEYEREVFHSTFGSLRAEVERLGLGDRVIFTGYLPDQDLVALLNLATVLVLPSLSEGFGLPAVEAAACGCPVIATTASPLPELLGEGGLYVDPLDQPGLELALVRVLDSADLRGRMRAAGIAAAARLTWEAAAGQLLVILRAAVAG